MVCDHCGAERPRTGPCPECGAPPPAPYGPTRGRSQPGGQRRPSGTNWGSGGSSGGRGLLSRGSGQSGDNWGDWDDGRQGAGRSSGRPSSPGYNYDPDSDSRALMPQYGQPMPPAAEDEMVSIPGFPQTDEEERAMGMRRPAYIPATEEKRKRKLSSWRVISGVMSIMVVCVASCAGAGFLGQRQIANMLPGPFKTIIQPPSVDLSQVPATPVSTPGPAAKSISSLITAKGVDSSYRPVDISSYFLVKSTVYAVMTIIGVSQNQPGTFSCAWYLNGLNFNLHDNTSKTVQPTKTTNFHAICSLPYNQVGVGMVRVYWNRPASDTSESPDDPYLAQTIKFAVLTQLPGTVTPGPGSPTPKASLPGLAPGIVWRKSATSAG